MNQWIWIWAVSCIFIMIIVILWDRMRTEKVMHRIEKMLEAATNGKFLEQAFDESRLSALETKFAHYLSAAAISEQNVTAEKDKIKALISDISHQTKIPVTNLLLHSELLKEEAISKEAQSHVAVIHEQTEKLRFLIDSLVKISRLENGILKILPRREALQPMLQEIEEEFASRAKAKGLRLQVAPTSLFAVFDPKWTVEALYNIVDNAVKYTEHGGITVSAVGYELFVRIDISDTGMGISEKEQAQIFSRFYRSERVSQKEGVGIGLYLAREIISGEEGYLKVNSKENKGSTFSVFLPKGAEFFQN